MKRIHKLPPRVANQIAAGEVITEPLSVIKELLENSLDAGARSIRIEIEKGGLDKILIVDDGEGIHYEDAGSLFERHSTSKISKASDLQNIQSFGFRGEALASIAAISKITLTTRQNAELQGFESIAYGGELLSLKRLAREKGTSFLIEDLFYNTPVRESFLKRPAALEGKITDFLIAMALGNPEISFRYHSDQKLVFQTFGGGEKETLVQLLGEDAKHLLPFTHSGVDYEVRGYLSSLNLSKTSRKHQYFFVNGRLVANEDLGMVLRKTYEGLLPLRRYPMAIFFIHTDPRNIDVNIHPRKMEIRFSEQSSILKDLEENLRPKLYQRNLLPKLEEKKPAPRIIEKELARYEIEEIPLEIFEEIEIPEPIDKEILVKEEDFFSHEDLLEGLHYIGQLFGTYLLFDKGDSFYLCDQHAAHEKILYERFMKEYKEQSLASQLLLLPQSLTLGTTQLRALEKKKELLERLGYEVELYSHQQVVLRSIPHLFGTRQAEVFFLDFLDGAQMEDEEALITRSCKAAIKAKDKLDPMEVSALLQQLRKLKDPFTCPHGRPIFIEMTRRELEARFER